MLKKKLNFLNIFFFFNFGLFWTSRDRGVCPGIFAAALVTGTSPDTPCIFLGYLAGSIMKLDVEKKELTQTWDDPNCRATEPQFVPRPGSTLEDDGVVVFVCLGTSLETPNTALVVLDPDLQELGRYSVPFATPVAFHGVWLP